VFRQATRLQRLRSGPPLPLGRHARPRRPGSRDPETETETETDTETDLETDPDPETETARQAQAPMTLAPPPPPILAVSAVVFDDAGRVLVVERGKPPGEGLWSVPGGRLEPGESIAGAVAREVREETGLVVTVGPLVAVLERIASTYHHVIHAHRANVTGGTLAPADDVRAARFVTDDELAALPTTEGLADVIAKARGVR
jgi:ADP-ribose pyrophosphatase YjhB (NUDIX family)